MAETRKSDDRAEPERTDVDSPKLSEMFDRAWRMFEDVDSTDEPLSSVGVQRTVKEAIRLLEETTRSVAQLDLFSRNEPVEEVSTADLRFLLLPALLGALTMKTTGREQRLLRVQAARVYYMDYLRRCRDYELETFRLPGNPENNEDHQDHQSSTPSAPHSDLVSMASHRQAKIDRYRRRKEAESRLSAMRGAVESGQAEDEVCREFYLLNVRRWITVCLEEIESIDQEVKILQNMDVMKNNPARPPGPPWAPTKPFILTKDSLQAQVFGAGYPSLATMTVDDWYEQHKKRGALPDQGVARRVPAEEDGDAEGREEEEKERKAEQEDQEALTKARDWDNWKDNHRRGYGNRHNMG